VLDSPLLALRHLVELLAHDPHNPPVRAGEISTGTLTLAMLIKPSIATDDMPARFEKNEAASKTFIQKYSNGTRKSSDLLKALKLLFFDSRRTWPCQRPAWGAGLSRGDWPQKWSLRCGNNISGCKVLERLSA